MSKLINIRGATGWLAGVMLTGGVFLIVASLGLIVLNIYFSAVGLVEATGGDANLIESIWFPALVVIKGGPIGLIVGLTMGAMSSVVQSVFWLTPVDTNEGEGDEYEDEDEGADRSHVPAPIITIFMALVMLYDVFSTWFYLSSSLPNDKNILMTLMRYIVTLVITLILMLPENHDPHPMTEAIDPNRFSEVELPLPIALNHFAICRWNQLRQLRDFEYFRIGKIGIHREIAWNLMLNHPIDQFDT